MRNLIVLSLTCVFAGCGASARDRSQLPHGSMNADVEFLLTSATTDFQTQRPHPVRFRKVRSGYIVTSDGARQYRLCGEFLPADQGGKTEWIPFATLKTSSYEQWLGGSALTFCKDASMTWNEEDLSSKLQQRLDPRR